MSSIRADGELRKPSVEDRAAEREVKEQDHIRSHAESS